MKTVYFQPSWSAKKIKEQVHVRGKNLGICIKEAYLDIYQNPCNREHIQYLQEKHIKSLYVTRIDYYSSEPLGYRILQHTEPKDWELYSERKDLYLNTAKKLNEIKKIVELKNQRFTFGGFGDSYSQELSNVIANSVSITKKTCILLRKVLRNNTNLRNGKTNQMPSALPVNSQ